MNEDDFMKITWFDWTEQWFVDHALLFLFALGLVGGFILGRKKRQIVSGLVWGGLLGPLGWIVIHYLPYRGSKCPDCLDPIDPAARKCRHCGSIQQIKSA